MTVILTLVIAAVTSSLSLASHRALPQRFAAGGAFAGGFVITDITDPLNGSPDTDAFDNIRGPSIRFIIGFDSIAEEVIAEDFDGNLRRTITTGPAQVTFFGDPTGYLQSVVAPTMNGPIVFSIRQDVGKAAALVGFELSGSQESLYFGFECIGPTTQQTGVTTSQGDPSLDDSFVFLRRFAPSLGMTDFAIGTIDYTLFEGGPVAVESTTFSQIKAMYRGTE